ncbi:hypothetical protein B0H19DRAFT_1110287 [Mycena capillaripes]|nr:hypothetical protein B0H19DRAFT_1110287 [Mycena capillaripes]
MSIFTDHYPTEILLQIFQFAVGDDPLHLGGTAVAFPISQVCRDWRQIALDSSKLWVDVRFPHGAYKNPPPILEELLARSRSRPLTAVFSHHEAGQRVNFWPFFNKMKEYCNRFRAIYAILPLDGMYALNGALGKQGFPLLVHLHLHLLQSDSFGPVEFGDTPALTVLHFEHTSYTSQFRSTSTNMRSMRFVDSYAVNIPDPRLRTLQDLAIVRSPLPSFGHLLELALTSLTLEGISFANARGHVNGLLQFLTSFRMPHLRHIEFANLGQHCTFSSQFFRQLVPPPVFPALRSAKFTALPFDDITPEFYQAFPALETLDLVTIDPWPMLKVLRADSSLCPALRGFYMDGRLRLR